MATVSQLPASASRLYDGPKGVSGRRLNQQGQMVTGKATWQVLVSDLGAFFTTAFGTPETFSCFGASITRIVPLQLPEYPFCYAVDFDLDYLGSTVNGFWQWANVTVMFESLPYPLTGDQAFCTVAHQQANRSLPSPPNVLTDITGLNHPFETENWELNGWDIVVTLHQMPVLPYAAYQSCANTVNTIVFDNNPVESVLYRGPGNDSYTLNALGVPAYEVTHIFSVSPDVYWNYGWLPGTPPTLGKLYKPDGSLRYPEISWVPLFGS